ncbi:ABC transporter permease [Xylophilus ampelinus]|uniref:Putative ABC transport system permease protein n=1 Tax=Xylophilus ampelinus TaxID=54067 RepID=A0A318SIB5_9BURK|nr:ABC transporter permease [Xylophilus ampelinus]MCS4511722.1 ABC transporter permease [Xylophilus ampelinus]PYE73774.1 putative ABC transport system permease protein [Xylophilus ampelinus]
MRAGFLLALAARSAWNRRFTLGLVTGSIALSTFMLLGVERIRTDLRDSFTSAISGTDLVVGARTGPVQLLLYAVFHIGSATNNIRWSSIEALQRQPRVAWVVPLSLGDSHHGFPVLATTPAYFAHFRYGERQPLRLQQGQPFADLFDAVIGAEVAERLGYRPGQRIVLAHGSGELDGAEHADKPFTVVGVLARTGTPVDRTVHIGLEAMEALHVDWMGGLPPSAARAAAAPDIRGRDLRPRAVTAALVGLDNRAAVFSVQRRINTFADEPLMAVLPGVALDELWEVVGAGERGLLLMSGLVAAVSMAGLVAVVLAGLQERRRELAVLRAVGATPAHLVALLAVEGALVTLAGILAGAGLLLAAAVALAPWLQSAYGLSLQWRQPTALQAWLAGGLLVAGTLAGLVPGWRAYRLSLADGLSPRN